MAGISKIASKDLDEVNKINSAVLIGLGTAVVGEVKTGSTFYAGSTVLKTGSGTQTLNPANENVPAGYYALTTLSAVDIHLAADNIKAGVNIFGFDGTVVEGALAEDVEGYARYSGYHSTSSLTLDRLYSHGLNPEEEQDVISKTLVFDSNSIAFATFFAAGYSFTGGLLARLYMEGLQMQESAPSTTGYFTTWVVHDFKALSGSKICKGTFYHAGSGAQYFYVGVVNASNLTDGMPYAIAVGSVKLA